ncbi:hypothetical protein M0804_013966 [Polistes exclamans]|nr:hypothetical protein M0804_013966 [Polistes exclamans]
MRLQVTEAYVRSQSRDIAVLRAAATATKRRFLRTRRNRDAVKIKECLEARRKAKRVLIRAIRKAKAIT